MDLGLTKGRISSSRTAAAAEVQTQLIVGVTDTDIGSFGAAGFGTFLVELITT